MSKTFDDNFEEVFKQDKKYVVRILKPIENDNNLSVEDYKLHYDEYPSLDEMKSWISAGKHRDTIELICVLDDEGEKRHAIINEEGKIYNLPVNVEATLMYDEFKAKHGYEVANDIVVGTCAVLTNFELE
tara:strand:+ start:128 stop:517 length:390 start_codon:yes stop_codon:yes gene_type:complete